MLSSSIHDIKVDVWVGYDALTGSDETLAGTGEAVVLSSSFPHL